MWWANVKMKIILGIVIIVVIGVIAVIIAVEVPKGTKTKAPPTTTSKMLKNIMGNY
jgi:hypothetical protein